MSQTIKTDDFSELVAKIVKKENESLQNEIKKLKEKKRESNFQLIHLLTNDNDRFSKKKSDENNNKQESKVVKESNISSKERINNYRENINQEIRNKKEERKESIPTILINDKSERQPTKKINNQSAGIIGRKIDSNSLLKAANRTIRVYLSRLDPDTTAEDVENYLKVRFSEVKCEPGRSKFPQSYSSFMITINEDNYKNIMNYGPAVFI